MLFLSFDFCLLVTFFLIEYFFFLGFLNHFLHFFVFGMKKIGNVCGLVGIDQFLLKSGTLSDSADFEPFHTMKFSVAAVVQVAVNQKMLQIYQN